MKLNLDLSGGFKIRMHRIILENVLFALMVYFYGWMALFLILIVLALEFVPYGKLDTKVNPWFKKYMEKRRAKEMAGDDDYDDDDNLDDSCPKCHREYDEIDQEYQICHLCGHVNNPDF